MELELAIALVAGLVIELFFRAIRYYSDKDNGPIPKYPPYNNYVTVFEYVSGGKKRWFNYFIFRNLPPLIVFVFLASIYQRYFFGVNISLMLSLTAFVSLIPRDIRLLIQFTVPVPEKIVHITDCLTVITLAVTVSAVSAILPLGFLAPSLAGVVDNAWSSLFVAILIVLYLDATNQQVQTDQTKEIARLSNYIVNSYNIINNKYGKMILFASRKNRASKPLLYAILIFENMNRPELVRKLENLIVRFFGIELTVGIAQVKSKSLLSNEDSIVIASEKLKGTIKTVNTTFGSFEVNYQSLREKIKEYNSSTRYIDSVIQILSILRKYYPGLFT